MIDPTDLKNLLTPTERLALNVARMPRSMRSSLDGIYGSTPQSRYNARKRAQRRLAQAQAARLAGAPNDVL